MLIILRSRPLRIQIYKNKNMSRDWDLWTLLVWTTLQTLTTEEQPLYIHSLNATLVFQQQARVGKEVPMTAK